MPLYSIRWLVSSIVVLCWHKSQGDFVKLQNDGGKWWLIDPDGQKTLSYAVIGARYENVVDEVSGTDQFLEINKAKFDGDRSKWALEKMAWLKDHAFNTLGPWSGPELTELYSNVTASGDWIFPSGDEYTIDGGTLTHTKGWQAGESFNVKHGTTINYMWVEWPTGDFGAHYTDTQMTWVVGFGDNANCTRKGSVADGWWSLETGDQYSIAGKTLTIQTGLQAGTQFELTNVTSASFAATAGYGDGSANFTSDRMTWANGQSAKRIARRSLLYTPILGFGGSFCFWKSKTCFPDVFAPEFHEHVVKMVDQHVPQVRDDEMLVGWYLDNELHWMGVDGKALLEYFQSLPESALGRQAADEFVAGQDASAAFADLNRQWIGKVSEKYHSVIVPVLREADPNHLILDVKFITMYNEILDPIVLGACPYVDALSFNIYGYTPGLAYLDHIYSICAKPIFIGETGFSCEDNLSGNLKTNAAGPILPTQEARAKAHGVFLRKFLSMPYAVGFNLFTWLDHPGLGSYGLMSLTGELYTDLLSEIREVYSQGNILHEGGQDANKCPLDSLGYYGGALGFLLSSHDNLCLTAHPDAIVGLAPCTKDEVQVAGPAGNWSFGDGNEYSISGTTMTLTKGWGVGNTYELSDVSSESLKIDSTYGGGTASYTCLTMTWSNGDIASRKDAKPRVSSQSWSVVRVRGRVGFRLKNNQTQGCLYHQTWKTDDDYYVLRADGNCSFEDTFERFPFARQGPPAWEHDSDCSLMQNCNVGVRATWAKAVCRYTSSCVSSGADGTVRVSDCLAGLVQQEFAFIDRTDDMAFAPQSTASIQTTSIAKVSTGNAGTPTAASTTTTTTSESSETLSATEIPSTSSSVREATSASGAKQDSQVFFRILLCALGAFTALRRGQ